MRLLIEHEIPLIDDDVCAELNFDRHRLKPAKAFDRKRLVPNCDSFSRCLAPGYRLGWTAQVEDAMAELGRIIRALT